MTVEEFKTDEEVIDAILDGAFATSSLVMSSALDPHQHICAHGEGSIIIWDCGAPLRAFRNKSHTFKSYRPDQYKKLRALMRRCDKLWREELLEQASGKQPTKRLKFEYVATTHTWDAVVGRVRVMLRPTQQGGGISFAVSAGANSDKSFSGFMPGCSLEDAKKYVYLCCQDSLPGSYGGEIY